MVNGRCGERGPPENHQRTPRALRPINGATNDTTIFPMTPLPVTKTKYFAARGTGIFAAAQ
jgi:hypothetical protein